MRRLTSAILAAGLLLTPGARGRARRRGAGPADRLHPVGRAGRAARRHVDRPAGRRRPAGADPGARHRHLDVAVGRAGLRAHPADRVLVGAHAGRQPGAGRGARPRAATTTSSWDTLGDWAAGDQHVRRTTTSGQADDLGSVNVDTWVVPGRRDVLPAAGDADPPRRPAGVAAVDVVGAMASRLPDVADVRTSRPGRRRAGSCSTCRATRRWCTAATTRSTAAAARPGARPPRPRWCSATTTRCRARGVRLGGERPRRPVGRPRGADDLRPRLRRHRQLAVQHRLRRAARPATRS